MLRWLCLWIAGCALLQGQAYVPSSATPPPLAREFRGVWIATVHNLDWPSAKGTSAGQQQSELRAMLDRLAALKVNAVMFQVRTQCDALYASSAEPWSPWLSGTMGKSPGYDPLAFCIREAHARGIEVHAWFNPFRALCNTSHPVASNHIARACPAAVKRHGSLLWCDPSRSESRTRAIRAVMEVVRRYDVDGVHLDDYFYPYPDASQRDFADGLAPAQRRKIIDGFVSSLYDAVKDQKPWVRVGISPFGIWKPGVPEGIEAGLDAYEQLAADSRKWLVQGWVDYLAPQLYWRISPRKQSFPVLLEWWRQQGSRPVWPGIATARIQSSEDPGRPASEITRQIQYTRQIRSTSHGHLHWSAKSLVQNRGGIATQLAQTYTQPALVPPMPWISRATPAAPGVRAELRGNRTRIDWFPSSGTAKLAVQAKRDGTWRTERILYAGGSGIDLPKADAIAVSAVDRVGNVSVPKVLVLAK